MNKVHNGPKNILISMVTQNTVIMTIKLFFLNKALTMPSLRIAGYISSTL